MLDSRPDCKMFWFNYFNSLEGISGSAAGLIISSALSMSKFQYGIRQSAETENQMTSVERVIEYSKLPSEAPLESSQGFRFVFLAFQMTKNVLIQFDRRQATAQMAICWIRRI